MKTSTIFCVALYTVLASACTTMTQVRDDTKTVGLMVKSVSNTAEAFQKQRDRIASANLRQRNALERLAMETEAATASQVAVWELSGDTQRKRLFEGVKVASEQIRALRAEQEKRAEEHAAEVAKARSAVSFKTGKLNEAAAGLVQLGEPRSTREEMEFLAGFIKEVRSEIEKNEKKAEDLAQEAESGLKKKDSDTQAASKGGQ